MSSVVITVDNVDITADVLFNTASFEQQFGAVPGTFSFTVRDPNRDKTFVTGVEMSLDVDGIRMFGGYVLQVTMGHMAPAADTNVLATYQLRTWNLRGSDYNIIFDKRVWRNTADYLSQIDLTGVTNGDKDGPALIELVANYSDCSDFTTTGINSNAALNAFAVVQQGEKLRSTFETFSYFGGAIWYIDGNKNFVYVPFEDVEKRWGFSDQPNHGGITTSPAEYQGSTMGFRQVEAQEDGSFLVNDALIWGGSAFAGPSGGTVFSRRQDATSQSTYGRWQVGETHFGEKRYSIQAQVNARSNVIINGPPGANVYGQQKGLRYTQWQFTFVWFSSDVPLLSGTPNHLVAGDIVTIDMNTFGVSKLLPLRSLRTSFPDALPDADPADRVVQFDGTFGLQLGDPFTLWRYVLANEASAPSASASAPVAVNDSSTTTVYGAIGQFTPTPATDGAQTVFTIPFGYIPGTISVYLNGLLQIPGTDFTESDNEAGEITMLFVPLSTDNLIILAATLDS